MSKYNVLVVDDEKEIVDAIEIYLQNQDVKIIKAYDGLEVLEVLNEEKIHLVIMEVMSLWKGLKEAIHQEIQKAQG